MTIINPLTTDDVFWHHLTLAACYQLPQSVLKNSFATSKRGGKREVGGFRYRALCTQQLPWLVVEWPWLALAGPFLILLAQTAIEPLLCPCRGTTSDTICSFQSGGVFTSWRALTIASSLMIECGQGHENGSNFNNSNKKGIVTQTLVHMTNLHALMHGFCFPLHSLFALLTS